MKLKTIMFNYYTLFKTQIDDKISILWKKLTIYNYLSHGAVRSAEKLNFCFIKALKSKIIDKLIDLTCKGF
jgi:hypothetical protein